MDILLHNSWIKLVPIHDTEFSVGPTRKWSYSHIGGIDELGSDPLFLSDTVSNISEIISHTEAVNFWFNSLLFISSTLLVMMTMT